MRTRIKICGITRAEDAKMALDAGADYVGLILTKSPRQLSLEQAKAIRAALPAEAAVVGVFADERPDQVARFARELALHAVQVAGWLDVSSDLACEVWHVLRGAELPEPAQLPMIPLRTYLLDAHDRTLAGGTGRRADWAWAKLCVQHGRRLFVAGGLSAGNVESLIFQVRPFGVDASSGLESEVGMKSPDKVRAFVERIHEADRTRPKSS
ncbi:MAG TPA: phosphoribosylanthranilate isomerase [Candidatus Dormibacteraeota bacterium]|nr:phosphoribosylanthranilate isomerase [Candidatus Dormibacteraeota bacterium]